MNSGRTIALKLLQLGVSAGLLGLFVLIFPGAMVAFAGVVALCYIAASVAAALDRVIGIWIAFAFTLLTFAFAAWGVYRYIDNQFDFLSGRFTVGQGTYWPPYLFVLIALSAFAVIVLHALSWRWMLHPRRRGHG